jgi:hypothetical protein
MFKSAFISYSTDASTKAKQVSGYLEPLGVDTFVFEKNLRKNQPSLSRSVREQIEKHDAVIMILSLESRESNWVSHELGIAFGMNKEILVIKTSHNLLLPNYLDEYGVTVLNKIEELDAYFENENSVQPSIPKTPDSKRGQKMAKKRVFTGFDFDHDEDLRNLLVGQSKKPDSPFELADWSVKEPMTNDWKAKVRTRIRIVDQVIIICGQHTDSATGVSVELLIAQDEKKPYFLLWGRANKTCKKPKSAKSSDKIYKWTWDNLKSLIGGAR